MTSSDLLEYCMSKPGADQSVDNQWNANQIKVGEVMFAMVNDIQGRPAISLKTSPEVADRLRAKYAQIVPGEHLNKAHWNTIFLEGDLPDSQFYYMIDSSYQLVVSGLPEDVRHGLGV
ncbi:MmcQ/YjbR family DNA-binding protein [Edaphovirga cremea]|jgi:predicted DNA-binding protein (MmcQ/YjbR family)|uniref:MmcQ/YjbR family DNA-binding protein n=1 Tax=Edaphovirga cremea TaxID=2267246 RepID=UPI000DEECAA5|nr:MmcQ/YjbR family DNA-binding protein [Edaphovirga cremea]